MDQPNNSLPPHSPLTKEETKAVFKAAIKEWMDEQFSTFGKWTASGLVAMAFGGAVWLGLVAAGWHK